MYLERIFLKNFQKPLFFKNFTLKCLSHKRPSHKQKVTEAMKSKYSILFLLSACDGKMAQVRKSPDRNMCLDTNDVTVDKKVSFKRTKKDATKLTRT